MPIHKYIQGCGFFADWDFMLGHAYWSIVKNEDLSMDYAFEFYPYKDDKNANLTDEFITIDNTIKESERAKILAMYKGEMTPEAPIAPDLFKKYKIPDIGYAGEMYEINYYIKTNKDDYLKYADDNDFHIKKKYYVYKNLIFNYKFKINPSILQSVDNFYQENMKNYTTIGVHFRCHAFKQAESRIKLEKNMKDVFVKLDKYINENITQPSSNSPNPPNPPNPQFRIYLATDVKTVLNDFIEHYKEKLLYNASNIWMCNTSTDNVEPHLGWFIIKTQADKDFFHRMKPGIKGGRELLIDALLLSKCDKFIKSMSNLSDWVFVLNPDIDEIIL